MTGSGYTSVMSTDLSSEIQAAAQEPKSVTADGVKVDQQSIGDMIEADRYLAGKNAANRTASRGLRFNKLSPPGAS